MGGLKHFNAENIIDYYLTSYNFKDGTTTENWEFISKILTSKYCDKPGNENKTLRLLIGKHFSKVSGSMSITRDQ